MHLSLIMAIIAVVASVLLFMHVKTRILPVLALIASGLDLLRALDLVRLSINGLQLDLVLGAALLVVSVLMYLRVSSKIAVAAASSAALLGFIQLAVAIRL